jgi:large repetitive protein
MADNFAYEVTGNALFGVVDLNTGVFKSVGSTGQTLAGLGNYGGIIYGGAYHGSTLYSVNTSTGALTAIGTGNISYGDFGSTTSGLYAFGDNGDLYSINPTNGAATDIGATSFGGIVMGMSSGSSTLYLTQNNSLYSLNTTTGSATLIGTTNEGESGFGALVSVGGTLYGGAYDASTPDIYSLDPQSAAATFVAASPATPAAPADGAVVNGYIDAARDTAAQALTGSAEDGSTVTVYDNGTQIGTTTANASTGHWGFLIGQLADGSTHSYTVTATDAAGNASQQSTALSFTVDITPPVTPAAPADDAVINGYVNAAHDTANQALTGVVEKGSTVTVYDNGTQIGTTIANASTGHWGFLIGQLANASTHSYTVTPPMQRAM